VPRPISAKGRTLQAKNPNPPSRSAAPMIISEHHPKGGRVQFKMSYSAVEQRVRHHDHHHEWQEQN
jgi:hypothetical protein